MPRGRRPDHDRRIHDLLSRLRQALIAREQARIESTVSRQMDGLVRGLGHGSSSAGDSGGSAAAPRAAGTRKGRPGRRGWSAEQRKQAAERMRKYWAARGKGGAKKSAAAKSSSKSVSPGRARQIAAMKEYWRKRRAAKGAKA